MSRSRSLRAPGSGAAPERNRAVTITARPRSSRGGGIRQGRRCEPHVPHALQLLELRPCGPLGLALPDVAEPALELGVAEIAAHLRLDDEPVDVVADLLQRADVGVRREAVERRLEAEACLGVGEARQHADALLAQPDDLLL